MEKQIAAGQRVSAATRAHAARLARAGHASQSVARSTARAGHRVVAGGDVTAIGDSVMSGCAMALAALLPGIYIDAQPGREMPAGLAVVRNLAASGQLRQVVVVGLGTNYLVTTAELQELLQLIGPHRALVLINTYVPDAWSQQVNATEAAFVRQHPGIVLADWYDTVRDRLYLLWPDQVHPEIPGAMVYARLVYQAVQATRGSSSSALAAQPIAIQPGQPRPQPS